MHRRTGLRIQEFASEAAEHGTIEIQHELGPTLRVTLAGASVASAVRETALLKRMDLLVIGRRDCIQSHGPNRLKANAYDIIRESPCPVVSV